MTWPPPPSTTTVAASAAAATAAAAATGPAAATAATALNYIYGRERMMTRPPPLLGFKKIKNINVEISSLLTSEIMTLNYK